VEWADLKENSNAGFVLAGAGGHWGSGDGSAEDSFHVDRSLRMADSPGSFQ
jgi:hypothetical protein